MKTTPPRQDAMTPLPPKPKPNGNEFENYVAAGVEHIFNRQFLARLIQLATLGAVLVGIVMGYASIKYKTDAIPTAAEREAEIEKRIAEHDATLALRVENVEQAVKDIRTDVKSLHDDVGPNSALQRRINRVLESR